MAQMRLILSFEMGEELDKGIDEEPQQQCAFHRSYVFVRPEKIKELTEDKGLLAELIRNMHRDYLTNGG